MKKISILLIVLLMMFTMIPTGFADVTEGYTGISALTALFIAADKDTVFEAYDTALIFIGNPASTFYTQSPQNFKDAIVTELPVGTFNALYDGTVAALEGHSQGSKTAIYEDLANVVSGQAPALVEAIQAMDLDIDKGSKVGTVGYYICKLAQEKKLATYDTYTNKLVFDLGRMPGTSEVTVDSRTMSYSGAGAYQLADVAGAIFTNFDANDYDDIMAELEGYLNSKLTMYIAAEAGNLDKMVNALRAFGFLNEYSTKPSTGGGGVPILPPEPAPENPGELPDDAVVITVGETATTVAVDPAAIETAVDQIRDAADGSVVTITIPQAAIPSQVSEQIVVAIPEAAMEDLAEAGIDVVLDFGGIELVIPGGLFGTTEGELNLQLIITSPPSSLEASLEDASAGTLTATRGLAPSFDINAIVVEHAGQTRLTDHGKNPLHFEYPLNNILPAYFDTLGLYYYNPTTGLYEFVSGQIKEGKLVAELTHLSEYAILNVVTSFTDMTSHWANRYVKSMAAKHVINGDGTGRFVPEDFVTRAEFVKMLVNVENLPLNGAPSFFEDVREDDWFKPYVDSAYASGLIYGGTSLTFLPNQAASRLEMMIMLSYAIDEEIEEDEVEAILSVYTDADQIPVLHRADLAKVIKAGLIEGYNGVLSLNEGLKRSEAATVMYRLFKR
ncbi:hypothetical protein SANA_27510 [Gottschalkiaceae bacterium SANA]|nr:hypothetical protein SANA_27510 [Gottschalkiaceae bacterium SANA]